MARFNTEQGQSLAEILIAATIGVILIGATVVAIVLLLRTSLESRTTQFANLLSEQYVDALKVLSESNWVSIYNTGFPKGPTSPFYLVPTSTSSSNSTYAILSGSTTTQAEGQIFAIYFTVENVNRDLCGIGRNMEKRLNEHDIDSVKKLCSASKHQLRAAWGSIEGERMYSRLRGEIVPNLPSQRGSVGHSHVLPPELRSRVAAYSVLHRLTQKAAMRLRSYKRITGAMHIKVKHINGDSWKNQARFDPTQDTLQLLNALAAMWKKYPKTKTAPLAVGITLSDLNEQTNQSWSLFDNGKSHDKLNAIIDSLNLRYGKNTVYFGGAHFALKSAPMRIAFNHIPDPVIEGDE